MSGNQSLERGLGVLELLDKSPKPLGVREIARQLALSPTIVQRLLTTLLAQCYVEQDSETRRYYIGYRAMKLGNQLLRGDRLVVNAHTELVRLAEEYNLSSYLGSRRDDRGLYLLSVQSGGPINIQTTPGELTYLHCTAMGKMLLSDLSDNEVFDLLGSGPLEQITPKTIVNTSEIVAQLDGVRKNGFAYVNGEAILGIISIAAPVYDASLKMKAALSVAFSPISSPELSLNFVTPLVKEAAWNVSRKIGGIL